MTKKLNILLSNDDGYDKVGIKALKESLKKYGTVYIAAPLFECSGASCSMTLKNDIKFQKISDDTIAVQGTPADSLNVGLAYYDNVNFDLIVSGINNGLNCSKDTLFSGTIGAGLIGSLYEVDTICFSAENESFDCLKNKTDYILDFIFKNNLLEDFHFLNVNYPSSSYDKGIGVKVGRMYNSPKKELPIKVNENTFRNLKRDFKLEFEDDSDYNLCQNGYYSLSPIKANLEDETSLKKIEDKIKHIQ